MGLSGFPVTHPIICGAFTLNDGMSAADVCHDYLDYLLTQDLNLYLEVCQLNRVDCQIACSASGFYEAFKENCKPRLKKPECKGK